MRCLGTAHHRVASCNTAKSNAFLGHAVLKLCLIVVDLGVCECHTMPGTKIGYAATLLLCGGRY
eukprot:760091-Rhodomonas_salina.2